MVNEEKEKKEKRQECLRAFNHYFPAHDRNSGVIKQIKKNLEEIKNLTDLEEKYQKADFAWEKHNNNEIYARGHYQGGDLQELGINYLDTIEKYHKLVQELWNLKVEISRELNSRKTEQNNQQRERERERQQFLPIQ